MGRFISPDTVIPDPTNPQNFNRYSYVYGNPVRYTDPSGHWGGDGMGLAMPMDTYEGVMGGGGGAHEGSVVSLSGIAGARITGIGPVVKLSVDLVTDEAGRGQLYFTSAVGYWTDGLIRGNEEAQKLAENMKDLSMPHGEVLPQSDSFVTPQVGFSITKGVIDKESYVRNGETVPADEGIYHVNDYEGLSRVVEGSLRSFTVSRANGFDPFMGDNGQWTNTTVTSGGYTVGFPDFSLADYTTQSGPISPDFPIPKEICLAVGLCGR